MQLNEFLKTFAQDAPLGKYGIETCARALAVAKDFSAQLSSAMGDGKLSLLEGVQLGWSAVETFKVLKNIKQLASEILDLDNSETEQLIDQLLKLPQFEGSNKTKLKVEIYDYFELFNQLAGLVLCIIKISNHK